MGARWPWITTAVALIAFLNPVGLDAMHAAFFSGEQLARNIWQPIVLSGFGVALVLALIEWRVRSVIKRGKQHAAPRQAR